MADKTPGGLNPKSVVLVFFSGAALVIPVGLVGIFTVGLIPDAWNAYQRNLMIAFFGSSVLEELGRFCIIYFAMMRQSRSIAVTKVVAFGAIASFGFSFAENILYAISLGWQIGLVKFAVATPIHLALGVTMGCFLALSKVRPDLSRKSGALALGIPILLHGFYDFSFLMQISRLKTLESAHANLLLPGIMYAAVLAVAFVTVWRIWKLVSDRSPAPRVSAAR